MEVYAGYGLTGFTGFRLMRLFDGFLTWHDCWFKVMLQAGWVLLVFRPWFYGLCFRQVEGWTWLRFLVFRLCVICLTGYHFETKSGRLETGFFELRPFA